MDDQELRSMFSRLFDTLENMQDEARGIREKLTAMQLTDADARADVKIATGNLNNAADALARTALVLQKSELARDVAGKSSSEEWRSEKVLRYAFITVGVLGAIAILGEKVLPALLAALKMSGAH